MKNTSDRRRIDRALAAAVLMGLFGAFGAARSLAASSGTTTELAPATKLDEEKALAFVKAYAAKKKIDFSRFESGRVRMEHRKDGRIYWSVSYKRIVTKDDLVIPGTDSLLFTVDDETKEVRLIPGY
jgi:hypothetical protein